MPLAPDNNHPAAPTTSGGDPQHTDPRRLLARLELRERHSTRLWERLSEQVAWFPNPVNTRQHQELLAEREHLQRQIAELRAQLLAEHAAT